MPRERFSSITPDEALVWLGALISASMDERDKTLNLGRSAELLNARMRDSGISFTPKRGRDGLSQLLALAGDFVNYPDDHTAARRAELVAAWCRDWLQPDDWDRINARIRKRRQRVKP
ncbi:hypothetical protein F0A16_20480 [Salinicola corii]|uniref:Uncharacterized protein n=1 Tax=Salinicola corii TaxID=2606937 RepID=A0A640W7F1_9GAMM|nr:hypothetical protein [Salinicola corii]KAA0015469.1 hypothetical protein F0A16_20480 [Salinicola corii]